MKSFRPWKRLLLLTATLFTAILFLPGPWGTTLIGAVGGYAWEESQPSRRAERELARARTYKPAAEELVRFCQTPSIRSMSASQCDRLGSIWLPEEVLDRVVGPLRASQQPSRALIPWGTVTVTADSARISLQGNMGYQLERNPDSAADGASWWTLYLFLGPSRTPLYTFSATENGALTREEALSRGYTGEKRLRKHRSAGPEASHGATAVALYLGDRNDARAAFRSTLIYRKDRPETALLNGLLLAEEKSYADGETLMLEWASGSYQSNRNFFLACFYHYSERPDKAATAICDMLTAESDYKFNDRGVLALTRSLYGLGRYESVVEICEIQLRPTPGYNPEEFYKPYRELLEAATGSRDGAELRVTSTMELWEPMDPFRACHNYSLSGSARVSILYVEHLLGRPIAPLGTLSTPEQ